MAGNAAFLRLETTLAWIGQFDPVDQFTAMELLRAMTLVSRDAFADRLRTLILQRLKAGNEPIGLYVERKLRHRHGVPFLLFKQTNTKVKRAYGAGPRPVEPTRAYDADVGSEGLIAQLVSELCREHRDRLYNHPGPNKIRKHRIRRFVLVTDFIGSGKRARNYIEAAWRVRSVKSWWSARATKGFAFEVVAYAAVQTGRTKVENHPSRPEVHVVVGCPTVENKFGLDLRQRVRSLCLRYSPDKDNSDSPLGFGNAGALNAFAHGIPNNAPLILHKLLHKRGKKWAPLFPARVTSATRSAFANADKDVETAAVPASAILLAWPAPPDRYGRKPPRTASIMRSRHWLSWMFAGLSVEWLPKYTPELNEIERAWRDLKQHLLAHPTFHDIDALAQAIHPAVINLNTEHQSEMCANLHIAA